MRFLNLPEAVTFTRLVTVLRVFIFGIGSTFHIII